MLCVMDVRLFFVVKDVRPTIRPTRHRSESPKTRMDTLHHLLCATLEAGGLSFRTSGRTAGKRTSMTGAIRLASLVNTRLVHSALEAGQIGIAPDRLV